MRAIIFQLYWWRASWQRFCQSRVFSQQYFSSLVPSASSLEHTTWSTFTWPSRGGRVLTFITCLSSTNKRPAQSPGSYFPTGVYICLTDLKKNFCTAATQVKQPILDTLRLSVGNATKNTKTSHSDREISNFCVLTTNYVTGFWYWSWWLKRVFWFWGKPVLSTWLLS